MAIQAQVPIVPGGRSGRPRRHAKGSAIVRPVHVSVRIGEPIATAGTDRGRPGSVDRACSKRHWRLAQ
jgi:hypothetical protein